MKVEEILDKANVKEFIAIVGGNVGGKLLNNVIAKLEPKQRDIVKVAGGLIGAYVMNELAERNPDYAEYLSLAGLAFTAIAAQPVADRISLEVSKATGTPIVVRANPVIVEPVTEPVTEPVIDEEKPEEIAVEL